MVRTTQIKPSLLLQPFIHCYSLREFDTGEMAMPMPLHAMNECYMTFFLKDQYCDVVDESGKHRRMSAALCSLFTSSQGCAYYKGNFALLSVQFKSNGFFAIFGIPQRLLISSLLPLDDILGKDVHSLLTEQLQSSKGVSEMGAYMNAYFTQRLFSQKHKHYTKVIAHTSNSIFRNKGLISVDNLAGEANMSLRNFERRFIDEVGMSPKLYIRITRFFGALENKMMFPQKNWTTITHESGYFDQAHFIKECREFASKTPEELFQFTPPPTEKFIEKVEL
jgi:AraC-like DNA-binding protein